MLSRQTVFLVLGIMITAAVAHGGCMIRKPEQRTEHVVSARPHEEPGFDVSALPAAFDWRSAGQGASLVTITRNQHIPKQATPHMFCSLTFLTLHSTVII